MAGSSFYPALAFLLAALGASVIARMAVAGTPLDRKPFSCPACVGFWFGLATSAAVFDCSPAWHFVDAFAAAGSNWILNRLVTGEW